MDGVDHGLLCVLWTKPRFLVHNKRVECSPKLTARRLCCHLLMDTVYHGLCGPTLRSRSPSHAAICYQSNSSRVSLPAFFCDLVPKVAENIQACKLASCIPSLQL
jgi:hypothetical protein